MLSRVTQTVETRETAAPATAGELLDLVRSGRASTRSQLRMLTGLSRTAVTARVTALTSSGLLVLGEELASTGGRPPGALVFNNNAGVVREWWCHVPTSYWFIAERDTRTDTILRTYAASEVFPTRRDFTGSDRK